MIEDLNSWVATAAGWITLINTTAAVLKWLVPKIRESLRQWRRYKRKR